MPANFFDKLSRAIAQFGNDPQVQQVQTSHTPPVQTTFQKNSIEPKESFAQDPIAMAWQAVNTEKGLRKPSRVTFSTLDRMSKANWVIRSCINTLRDEISARPFDIVPIEPKKPYSESFRQYLIGLFNKPNQNIESWRTFIDSLIEDILKYDAGVCEKVRDQRGRLVELWNVDGSLIKPLFDEHGYVGKPAYQQFFPDQRTNDPVAEWKNEDMIYMMWNPQKSFNSYGWGFSPVEGALSCATAFLYAEAYNMGFFRQNTIPPVLINMGQNVPSGQVDSFKNFLAAEMMGEGGFWKPVIGSFGDGFGIEQLQKTPVDLALKDYLIWQMRWIVALFRMSPQDIGFTLDQYKVEGQVQQQLSKNKAISSLGNVIEGYFNREVIGDKGWGATQEEINLQFQWIDTPIVDPLQQAQVDQIYLSTGKTTINELRVRDGQDPIVGGRKAYVLNGQKILPLDATPLDQVMDEEEGLDEDDNVERSFNKKFTPEEGTIVPLIQNQTAICWMDDRGVTQPLFVTDYGKTQGFTVKPNFLDERKEQDPPEEKVSKILRLLKVNTPEVKIMSYDEVVRLLPTSLYGDFTKWINLEAPFNSQQWRDRWLRGDRKSEYFIVTGYLNSKDLNSPDLQNDMRENPESYTDTIKDFARIWLAERKFYLGDRKPGHYLVTASKAGFGVDYQFYKDQHSWEKTNVYLPAALTTINPVLKDAFIKAIEEEFSSFETLEKAFRGPKADTDALETLPELEKKISGIYQQKIYSWYRKAVHVKNTANSRKVLQKSFKKAKPEFDPNEDYLTTGEYVYQNGIKYPASVLDATNRPGKNDLNVDPSIYRDSFDYGVLQAQIQIKPNLPEGIKLANPQLYAPTFEKRENLIAETVDKTLRKDMDALIVKGFEMDATYGETADSIAALFGVTLGDPDFPGWRAMRIARSESMWSVNEAMRQQYAVVGINKVNISTAPTACPICIDAASKNPYSVDEAENLLGLHPNCRCILVGDWSDFLKSYQLKKTQKGWEVFHKGNAVLITEKDFEKGWITVNGHHVLIRGSGQGGGGSGSGGSHKGSSGQEMKIADVPGISLKRAGDLVSHGTTDPHQVSQYKQLIRNGHPIAPVRVARQDGQWHVQSGHDRLEAYKQLGESLVPTVHHDTMGEDAVNAYDRTVTADQRAMRNLPSPN